MEQTNPHYPSDPFSSVMPGDRGPLGLAGRIDRFGKWLNREFTGRSGDRDFFQAVSVYARSDGFVAYPAARHQYGDQRVFAFNLALLGSSEAVAVFGWREAERDWIRVR
jgi:hypothetical protein